MPVRKTALSDLGACLIVACLACLPFLPGWARGMTPYWGDLTYLHFPWRALAADMLQAGRLPLWNPYVYFGMPLAAQMQSGVFYPGSIVHALFGFATGTAIFHAWHYGLAGWLMFLWLRRGLPRIAALTGAVVFVLGGGLISRAHFLNHLAVLALLPAFLLFFESPTLLALALACAFLAGFPPFLVGGAALAWALRLFFPWRGLEPRRAPRAWVIAVAVSAGTGACLLLPALELLVHSRRAAGLDFAEAVRFGYVPGDFRQWISPLAVPLGRFDPAAQWWKCSYLGFMAWTAAGFGLLALPRRRAWALTAALFVAALLMLGDSTSLSRLLWSHVPPLRFVRYPGNFFYLALPVLSVLAAAGAAGRSPSRAGLMCALIAVELSLYGQWSIPWTDRGVFASPGPLARFLQSENAEDRYLLSPLALENPVITSVAEWRQRLYGMTNAPARLYAAGNFGEPLVPKASYEFMDALYSAAGAEKAAELFPWGDIRFLLMPSPGAGGKRLRYEGRRLWEIYRYQAPLSRARGFDEREGAALPEGLPREKILPGRPLVVTRSREDRFEIQGDFASPGWAFVSEPFYPGWKVFLRASEGVREVESVRALLAFQKVAVPAGAWRLEFRYAPLSFWWGLVMTTATIMACAWYWYNKLIHAAP